MDILVYKKRYGRSMKYIIFCRIINAIRPAEVNNLGHVSYGIITKQIIQSLTYSLWKN